MIQVRYAAVLCFVTHRQRRRMETEDKAKVVASIFGGQNVFNFFPRSCFPSVYLEETVQNSKVFFFKIYSPPRPRVLYFNCTVLLYSVICRPSDHTVGRPRAENRTRDGRSRGKDSHHQPTTPPCDHHTSLDHHPSFSIQKFLPNHPRQNSYSATRN